MVNTKELLVKKILLKAVFLFVNRANILLN